ncbi:type II toxin-antitoxin system Phd/YefM family antitoxin [Rhizobium panacihumi]|uniref:type II toxin-antitoxin system Phd/YefM family antitoxin n=1 Tax=Rhizobium panacihumi TaxID=2008450 RepID=UPI003D79E0DF
MKTVNIQEAQKNLSRLLEEAAKGEPFVVTREGKPSLKVTVEVIDELLLQDNQVDTVHED